MRQRRNDNPCSDEVLLDTLRRQPYGKRVRAALLGLEDVNWASTRPNQVQGAELPTLIRELSFSSAGFPQIADALLHQGSRFGGAAEALPFLIELASADETPARPQLVQLAAGIGAPVEPALTKVPFDRNTLSQVSDEVLCDDERYDLLNGFAAMWAIDGRAAWCRALPRVSKLVDDADPNVRLAAICALAGEPELPAAHHERLARALDAPGAVGWHAALGLAKLTRFTALSTDTTAKLEAMLHSDSLTRRVAAGVALAHAQPLDDRLVSVLAEAEVHFTELSQLRCHFEQPLMGMVSAAIEAAMTKTR